MEALRNAHKDSLKTFEGDFGPRKKNFGAKSGSGITNTIGATPGQAMTNINSKEAVSVADHNYNYSSSLNGNERSYLKGQRKKSSTRFTGQHDQKSISSSQNRPSSKHLQRNETKSSKQQSELVFLGNSNTQEREIFNRSAVI